MNNTKEKKCIDLVADKFAEQEQTYKDAHQFLEKYDDATEGEQIALKVIDKHNGNISKNMMIYLIMLIKQL